MKLISSNLIHRQQEVPIYQALLQHRGKKADSYHVPGHKQGINFTSHEDDLFQSILQIDQTEIAGLDDLHHPSGAIAKAQILASEAFGAKHTFYLVGGSTSGNLASILTVCQPGDQVILQRSCHQSVFHACMLAGITPIYWNHTYNQETGFEESLDLVWLEKTISQSQGKIKLVVVTCPSYYGIIQPIGQIADICHRFDIVLHVDEAHGAHFGFHPDIPASALSQDADLVVQSTHKMLASMTMSSMLHVGSDRIKIDDLQRWLRVVQSSSPSYPLLASLDLARRQIAVDGYRLLSDFLNQLDQFKKTTFPYCKWVQEMSLHKFGIQDPCKMVIASRGQVSGTKIQAFLENLGVYTELADHQRVLFCFSLAHPEGSLIRLNKALLELDKWLEYCETKQLPSISTLPQLPTKTELVMSFQEIRNHKAVRIQLEEAEGGTITEPIVPYPPGIPVLLPGERLTKEWVQYLTSAYKGGYGVRGLHYDEKTSAITIEIIKK